MQTHPRKQVISTTAQSSEAIPPDLMNANQHLIEFVLHAPRAGSVCLAGSFNEWNPSRTPMKKDWRGRWKTTIPLPPGKHEYKFILDGEWVTDPQCRETVANPFGGENSVISVQEIP